MAWGAAIGAIGSIAGGLLSGGGSDGPSTKTQLYWNHQNQKEFARNGIRWRVADAKRAGIHPLAALGAQTHSFSPTVVAPDGGSNLGAHVAQLGQDIGRAVDATRTRAERFREIEEAKAREARTHARQEQMDQLNLERHRADLQHMDMQNQLLASQIARYKSAQVGPGMPANLGTGRAAGSVDGTTIAGAVEVNPAQITSRNPQNPTLEAGGPTPGFKEFRIGGPQSNAVLELPNEAMSQSMESLGPLVSVPAYLAHHLAKGRDYVFNGPSTANLPKLPSTHYWRWNPIRGRHIATRKKTSSTHNPWKRY